MLCAGFLIFLPSVLMFGMLAYCKVTGACLWRSSAASRYTGVILSDKTSTVHVPVPVPGMSSPSHRVTSAKSVIPVIYLGEQQRGGVGWL